MVCTIWLQFQRKALAVAGRWELLRLCPVGGSLVIGAGTGAVGVAAVAVEKLARRPDGAEDCVVGVGFVVLVVRFVG